MVPSIISVSGDLEYSPPLSFDIFSILFFNEATVALDGTVYPLFLIAVFKLEIAVDNMFISDDIVMLSSFYYEPESIPTVICPTVTVWVLVPAAVICPVALYVT